MKSMYKIGAAMFLVVLLINTSSNAQEFKAGKSIIEQLKNGTVSELKFTPAAPNIKKFQVEEDKVPQYTKGNFKTYLQQKAQVAAGGNTAPTRGVQQTQKVQSVPVQLVSDNIATKEKPIVPEKTSSPEKN